MTLREMRQRRGELVSQMRAIIEAAGSETLNAQDQERWDRLEAEQESLRTQIEQAERDASMRSRTEALAAEMERSAGTRAAGREAPGSPENREGNGEREVRLRGGTTFSVRGNPQVRDAFRRFILGGVGAISHDELRALQADSDTAGGYLRPDQEFVAQLIQAVDDQVFIMANATVLPVTNADSLGAPSLDTDISDANWTSELLIGTADTSLAVGKRELRPHPLAKPIKISNKLLRQTGQGPSVLDAERLVRERLAYKFGVTMEKGFLTGTGAQQPLGVFTASSNGISTSRDVSTGNTTTEIGADNLIETKYSVKAQYQRTGRWLMHRAAVKQVAKLKDGDGQYLWRPGLTGNDPDTILGRPLDMSEFAPSTFTTGLYVGLFGDFSKYWIAIAMDLQVQRVVELYAATNETGFFGRAELDGAPVQEEAFARMKLA